MMSPSAPRARPAAGLLSVLLGAGCARALPPGDPATPDVVFVSIDTLRADHLGAHGYPRATSPFLDQLAAQGARYSQARSASPWTLPAHTTMLSGQLPLRHRIIEDSLKLDAALPFLPAAFAEAGYATAAFVSTFYVSGMYGFDRGFSKFEDFGIHDEKVNLRNSLDARQVVDEALDWWKGAPKGQPVFLFLHFYDVHYQYDPPAPWSSRFDDETDNDLRYKTYAHYKKKPPSEAVMAHQIAQYDESIAFVDDQLRRIADAAAAAGRPLRWVVTADHGEEFLERGSWGHAHTLYAEQLHIPLILSGPGVAPGVVVDTPVGNQDLAPTVAAWVGLDPAPFATDGVVLTPGGPLPPADRPFPAETTRFKTNRLGLRSGDLRLEWDLAANAAELFDLAADPAERTDLAAARPDDVRRLQDTLIGLHGAPWTASAAGDVAVDGGVVLRVTPAARAAVSAGEGFATLPWDAPVRFFAPGAPPAGPAQPVGGAVPAGFPLTWSGGSSGLAHEVDDATRAMLEAIGYEDAEE
jgi:arylsulfatase A-like enzyme